MEVDGSIPSRRTITNLISNPLPMNKEQGKQAFAIEGLGEADTKASTPEKPKGPEDAELTNKINELKQQSSKRKIELLNGLESVQQNFLHWGSEMPDYIKKFKKRIDSFSEKIKLATSLDEGKGLAGNDAEMYSDAQKSIGAMNEKLQSIIDLTKEGKEPSNDPETPETLDLILQGSFELRPHFRSADSSEIFAIYEQLNDSWEDLAKQELKKQKKYTSK